MYIYNMYICIYVYTCMHLSLWSTVGSLSPPGALQQNVWRRRCARIKTILRVHPLWLGTPPYPVIAHTIAHYNVSPRPSVIAIHTTQYWQCQYRVKAKWRQAATWLAGYAANTLHQRWHTSPPTGKEKGTSQQDSHTQAQVLALAF